MFIAVPARLRTSAAHCQVFVPPRRAALQFAAGAGLFGLGAVIYWLARPAGFGFFWMGPAPSFVHPLAMILLCAAVLRPDRRALLALCVLWVAINLAFEAGQGSAAAQVSATWLDANCGAWIACQRTSAFFLRGTFDWLDVLAAIAGGVLAWCVLRAGRDGSEARP